MSTTIQAPESLADWLVLCGLGKAKTRMLVGALVAGTVSYALRKPACFFTEDGGLKPCKLVEDTPESTMYHWSLVPITGAVAFGVLV